MHIPDVTMRMARLKVKVALDVMPEVVTQAFEDLIDRGYVTVCRRHRDCWALVTRGQAGRKQEEVVR